MTMLQENGFLTGPPPLLQEEQAWVLANISGDPNQEEKVGGSCSSRRRRRRRSRVAEGEARKRKLSDEQVKYLELRFGEERKLESGRKTKLASELGLDPKQIAVWFQNRRARWKSKKIEEEYVNLKFAHESVVLEKCHLEAEVLKLKEQLLEAKEKIEKLSLGCGDGGGGGGCCGGVQGNSSPSTSASVETQQPFFGEIGALQQAEQVSIDDYGYINMWDVFSSYGI